MRVFRPLLGGTVLALWVGSLAVGSLASAASRSQAGGHSATGTIEAYDGSTRVLSLRTGMGSTLFDLEPDARVWTGSRSVSVDELEQRIGARATVQYTVSGERLKARSVRVKAAASSEASR